jgi:hypothetical protein
MLRKVLQLDAATLQGWLHNLLVLAMQIITPFNVYFNSHLIFKKGEIWRLLTNFFFFGNLGKPLLPVRVQCRVQDVSLQPLVSTVSGGKGQQHCHASGCRGTAQLGAAAAAAARATAGVWSHQATEPHAPAIRHLQAGTVMQVSHIIH